MSFLDHEKLLKEVGSGYMWTFMNVSTKNQEMKHCLCRKYDMIYRPDFYNLQIKRKQHVENKQELKFANQIMSLLNNLQYRHSPKI